MSEAFNVKVGVHQGSVLSPFLLAIVNGCCVRRYNGGVVV
jgi:hypothetical protein